MVKISEQCIGCGLCMAYAPTIFKVEGIPAQVIKQPETPEEEAVCKTAIDSCPVKAISD